jgi:hypothetical protein
VASEIAYGAVIIVVYIDTSMRETRYAIPQGADWAAWDDVNAVLSFMSDEEVIENARQNLVDFADTEFVAGLSLPDDATPEQAWEVVNQIWEGDPGGRGWQVRVPAPAWPQSSASTFARSFMTSSRTTRVIHRMLTSTSRKNKTMSMT